MSTGVTAIRAGWLGSLQPLRHTMFRWLWLASFASQLGTWTLNVGAVDQMTLVAPTALLLALVQTAISLPGLLLALPAGALADIVDRRLLLLLATGWMLLVSALLSVTTFDHLASSWLLLAMTFAIGVGSVAGLPAWQAIIPELIPREELAPAVTLSSIAINLARMTGPALGGVAVALAGPGAAFALTAVAFAATAAVVVGWRRAPAAAPRSAGMAAALWFGLRYSIVDPPVRATLIRAASFILFGSSLWALMPLVSQHFGTGFVGYSGLLGALGVGAVAAGVLLTRIRGGVRPDGLVLTASFAFATVALGVAIVPSYWIALLLMPAAGWAWVCAMSTFNVGVQLAAPEWTRGRVLASYQVTQMGSLAVGSAIWGAVASRLGLGSAMAFAAMLLAAVAVLALRWGLNAVWTAAGQLSPAHPLDVVAAAAPRFRLLAPLAVLVLVGSALGTVSAAVEGAPYGPAFPAPVQATVGESMRVAGLQLTVLSAVLEAPPLPAVRLAPGDRLVVVQVLYQTVTPGEAASPYDWVVTDASGTSYSALVDGIAGALPARAMGPSGVARGLIGFAVPRAAGGLVLHFHAARGDESALVPLD